MSRPALSVVVTASGTAEEFRAGLETLRLSRGQPDEIVCVVPEDRPDLLAELDGKPWLRALEDASGEQGQRWATGLAATRHPLVVLLDGDVVLPARWLDPIVEAFRDPEVVAVGPRCHHSYGPQGVEVPETALRNVDTFKAFARGWRHQHRGHVSAVDRLGPVCLAVRREALERAGGPSFDQPYDRLREQGRILLAHEAPLGHADSAKCTLRSFPATPRPLVSGVLIVKDEEDVLGVCLTALQEFVDEIVVYDTGSTDRTREIAAEHGARVVEGYWDDHFGDARNRALAHCTGEWVLAVDADELMTGTATALRGRLLVASEHAFLIPLVSQQGHDGSSAPVSMLYPRLFRLDRARYVHRFHEQVVDRVTGQVFAGRRRFPDLSIVHYGYTEQRMALKDKRARNLRLAALAVDDDDANAATHLNLARSLVAAGDYTGALDASEAALRADPGHAVRVMTLKNVINANLALRRLAEANAALDELRRISVSPIAADEWEARVRFAERDYAAALALVEAFPEAATDDALTVVGRRGLAEADDLLEALWSRPGAEAPVLAFAAQIGGRLPVIRALEWSARLRACGLERHCTLLTLAADVRRTPRERSLAAAVALETFGDETAMPLLGDALGAVATEDEAAVLDELALLAPGVAAAIEPAAAH